MEFTTITDHRGRVKADMVTGPMGSFVQGAPRPVFKSEGYDSGYERSSFGRSSRNDDFGDFSNMDDDDDDMDDEDDDDGKKKRG